MTATVVIGAIASAKKKNVSLLRSLIFNLLIQLCRRSKGSDFGNSRREFGCHLATSGVVPGRATDDSQFWVREQHCRRQREF